MCVDTFMYVWGNRVMCMGTPCHGYGKRVTWMDITMYGLGKTCHVQGHPHVKAGANVSCACIAPVMAMVHVSCGWSPSCDGSGKDMQCAWTLPCDGKGKRVLTTLCMGTPHLTGEAEHVMQMDTPM